MNIMSSSTRRSSQLVGFGSCISCLPQNGVVESTLHYGSGNNSSPQVAVASTIDSLNGNAVSSDTQKRPKMLGVNKHNLAISTKDIVDDNDEDGSLPCTPELQLDSELDVSCPAGDAVLENDTRQLISSFLRDFTGLSKPRWMEEKALSTMKRVVGDLLDKHRYPYNGMVNKLDLDKTGDNMAVVAEVAKSMFRDGKTNWGRIASLVAFAAVVCQSLKETRREHCVELVAQEISTYLLTDQRDWLVKNNAWDGFVEFFRVSDPESAVRTTLMAFAGVAGIGATLALLIR